MPQELVKPVDRYDKLVGEIQRANQGDVRAFARLNQSLAQPDADEFVQQCGGLG